MRKYRKKEMILDKPFTSRWLWNTALVIAGSLVLAFGYSVFIVPFDIVPGGVYGISIVLHQLTGIPVGIGGLLLNIPLLLLGMKLLGSNFGIRTIFSIILTAVSIDLFLHWTHSQAFTEDILISAIFGGFLIGVGVAIVLRANATTGGTAIMAQVLSKYTGISVGRLLLVVDGFVVLAGIIAFRDINLAPYAIITIFTISRSIDVILNGLDSRRVLLIVSEKHEDIRDVILNDLDRGGSYIQGRGLYFNEAERQIILSALSQREALHLEQSIRGIDPEAFIIALQSSEVLGRGHKALG